MNLNEKYKNKCKILGQNIRKLREEKGLELIDLSKKTGIRIQYLKQIEEGKAYHMRICSHLLKISEALEVKLSELLQYGFDSL